MLKFESIVKIDDPYNSANNKLSVFQFCLRFYFPNILYFFLFGIEKLKPGACLTQDLYYLPFLPQNYHWVWVSFISFIIWKLKVSSSGHFSIGHYCWDLNLEPHQSLTNIGQFICLAPSLFSLLENRKKKTKVSFGFINET